VTTPRTGLVAVLFTDLVSSTELMTHLGQRSFDELRRRHFAALAGAVTAYGGEEVKNTGDGVMAVFPSATQAVDAAVAMQRATLRHGGSVALSIRVGVAVGDATFEAGDVFGAPVVEAARLVASARPGQILAGAFVPAAAGDRTDAAFVDIGPLELKGFPGPVSACEVIWKPLSDQTIRLPALLAGTSRLFVGREREVVRLTELWTEAAAGERRLALVAGEPGVGKTRLAAELAARLHADGAMVLAGRCDEDLGVPYQPFVEALRDFAEYSPPAELPVSLGRHPGELVRLVPDLADRLPRLPAPLRSDPETERYRLFDAVAAWLADACAARPGLLVLDDVHWAVKPTLLLLRHLLRFGDPLPLLVVATYRDSELRRGDPLSELVADVRRLDGVERITLSGLKEADVAAFIEASVGHRLSAEDATLPRAVWAETDGNPFFVAEILRHLGESGWLEPGDRRRRVATTALDELGIPEGVRDVIGRRLSRLSDDTNRVLSCASALGLEFETAVVERAGGFSEDVVLSALDEAVASRLVVEVAGTDGRSGFAHALVRATLYDQLTASRRRTLHRRVGEAIETLHRDRLDDHLPALAHHFASSGADASSKAIRYATAAGDRAMAQLAFEAAVGHYEQALAAIGGGDPSDQRRPTLLLSLGRARARAGDARAADAYLSAAELARRVSDAETLAGSALGLADLWAFSGSVDDTRIGLLEEARNALGDTTSPIAAQLLARLATELYNAPGTWDRRAALTAQSVDVARRLGDPLTLALSLHARNYAMWAPGGAQERLDLGREIVELAHQGGDPELALHGHTWCQTALLELGDVAGLDRALSAYERLADDLRQPRYRWYATTRRTMQALLTGDLDKAESLARAARALGDDAGEADAENVFVAQMRCVWDERPCQEAIDVTAAHYHMTETTVAADSPLTLAFRLLHLLLLFETARQDDVRAELAEFLGFANSKLDPSFYGMGWSILATLLATAAVRLADPAAAATLYDVLLPYAGLNAQNCGAVSFDGAYTYHLGMLAATLGRWDEAEGHLADAAVVHERMAARVYLVRTRLALTATLLNRRRPGDVDRADQLLSEVISAARELGLVNTERRAVALLNPGTSL
jgi:class 3 adenylate cyclase/tetratricopeptide (TPR) repeat protein